ncbi:MAG: helix-turn-helix domain-containing protein [Clostridiales bacterium]|nr:helix-turn-helix domain-containing protein [Clostridiales bacterium]
MRKDNWYEQSADAPDYIYFQNFPDMAAAKYRFAGLHVHQSLEVLVVYRGCMRCMVNNRIQKIGEGEIFLVNSYDSHHYEYIGNAAAYILVIGKEYISHIIDDKTEFNNFLHPTSKVMAELMKLITDSYERFPTFNNLQKRGFVNSMMGILYNSSLLRKKEKNSNKEFFIKVSEYISTNYGEDLKLPVLARKFGYSENYFSALFNRMAGINLNEYVNRIRIRKVLENKSLMEKKYTLKEIVLRCGFNSMETYYRVLKKYKTDGTNGEYKAMEKSIVEQPKEQTVNKKRWAVIVGYGNRGQVYADYSLDCPEELGIAAIVDPNEFKLSEAKKRYGLSDDQLFTTFDAFLKKNVVCDFVINATMDQIHYETAMQILSAGYDMAMEKPIVPNAKQLMDIKRLADEKGCQVFVTHVLRYTPYYSRVKKLIKSGELGEIMTMEMNEHVCIAHYLTAYTRGKWNSEAACGSGFLLAKCCHDLDLMCWLNNETEPERVCSFGTRAQFVKEKKPEGATEYCYQCKVERDCPYSAIKMHMEMNAMPFLTWDSLNKPLDEITDEEKMEFLKKNIYGKCAYDNLGDLVDRQNVIVSFKNGSNCTFTLTGGAIRAGRYLHIVGTKGEVEGQLEKDEFVIRRYVDGSFSGTEEKVSVKDEVISNARFGGHNGGDFAIMHDLVAYYNGDRSSVSITKLEDSVNGHLCVFAAEKSRKEKTIVEIDDMKK